MSDDRLLLRQIHPSWLQNNRVTSQALKPTPKDSGKLSVYDGDMITAEDAWHHYTEKQRLRSIGVLAVSGCECNSLELPVLADPEPFPEHVVVNFTGISRSQIERKAKTLTKFARMRGWQYQASES
jgi:hypothetical protein